MTVGKIHFNNTDKISNILYNDLLSLIEICGFYTSGFTFFQICKLFETDFTETDPFPTNSSHIFAPYSHKLRIQYSLIIIQNFGLKKKTK